MSTQRTRDFILPELLKYARDYSGELRKLLREPERATFRTEETLARSAYYTLQRIRELRELDTDTTPNVVPFDCMRAISNMESSVSTQLRAWGWLELDSPTGTLWIVNCINRHDATTYVLLLQSAINWQKRPDARDNAEAGGMAEEARRRGMLADGSMTTEQAEAVFWERHESWRNDPAFGAERPHVTPEAANNFIELLSPLTSAVNRFEGSQRLYSEIEERMRKEQWEGSGQEGGNVLTDQILVAKNATLHNQESIVSPSRKRVAILLEAVEKFVREVPKLIDGSENLMTFLRANAGCDRLVLTLDDAIKGIDVIDEDEPAGEWDDLTYQAIHTNSTIFNRIVLKNPELSMGWGYVRDSSTGLLALHEQAFKRFDMFPYRLRPAFEQVEIDKLGAKAKIIREFFDRTTAQLSESNSRIDDLTGTQEDILTVMLSEGCICLSNALTQEEITRLVNKNASHTARNMRESFKTLKAKGLTDAKNRCGTWLTPKGIEAVKNIKKRLAPGLGY